jgi:hypothetical protein
MGVRYPDRRPNALPLSRERRIPRSRLEANVPAPLDGCSGWLASRTQRGIVIPRANLSKLANELVYR